MESFFISDLGAVLAQVRFSNSEEPAWITPVVSIVGIVITTVAALVTALLTQARGKQSEADARFSEAITMLGDPTASRRACALSVLTEMAAPAGHRNERYFTSAVEGLCSYVRFDRDMYCRDAVFDALKRLQAQPEAAVEILKQNLQQDLLRQIGEFAAYANQSLQEAQGSLCTTAPEAEEILHSAFSGKGTELKKQLEAAADFPPDQDGKDRKYLAWSVRLTGRDLARDWS